MRMKSLRKRVGTELHDGGIRRQEHDGSRRERWADLSDRTTDTGSTSTWHQDLDNDAAEQELLEKIMRDTLRVPQRYVETLRDESGQKGWAEHFAAWQCWMAEQA